jgi:hypothetical protein
MPALRYGYVLCAVLALFGLLVAAQASNVTPQPTLVVVVGAAGEEEFGARFEEWAATWESAANKGGIRLVRIGVATNAPVSDEDDSKDRNHLKAALEAEIRDGPSELWMVFIGHGTFDGKEAKFNLNGTDFSATELGDWLKPFTRPVAVINTSAASAPFIKAVSAPGRAIVTATRSGHEQNFAYFGKYMGEAVGDPKADLDKDGQVSLLEAFLIGARRTAEFYDVEGRLATEHAMIDDNGDGLGTPSDFFRGIRAVKKPAQGSAVDGMRAHQFHLVRSATEAEMPAELRAKRDALELQVEKLREEKPNIAAADYYSRLEELLVEMSKIYEAATTR